MPHNHQWQSRIKAVEREYLAMRQAANRFQQTALDDPTILRENLRHGEIVVASTEPRTIDLLNGLAARCGIPDTQRDNAHLVRDYRNAMVHEREEIPAELSMADARSYLCRFFSFLPHQW